MMRKSLRELDDLIGADEWRQVWLPWLAEYDLPDAYFVVGRLGPALAAAFGGSTSPEDFVPYYRQARRAMSPQEIAGNFARAREVAAGARRDR